MNTTVQTASASWRKTTQDVAPACIQPTEPGNYDLYPVFPLGEAKIELGHTALAQHFVGQHCVILEGFGGVLWDRLRAGLEQALAELGIQARWVDASEAMKPWAQIDTLTQPFMGQPDSIFGTRCTLDLKDLFDADKLAALQPAQGTLNIIYGPGAALAGWEGLLVYVDTPKNEIQFRSRAKTAGNLGMDEVLDPKPAYKRFYFIDWPLLSAHKQGLLPRLDLIVDEQRPQEPVTAPAAALREAFTRMSRNFFRVRPWFEPGPWGGQWCKKHIRQLPEAPNYAWSFELIVPENGLTFASGGKAIEVSFDMLMFQEAPAVLGRSHQRFGTDFPIRFDYLDTFDGGNLSVQCHPHPDYTRAQFGENFTQDETYYIMDCEPDARVYLGFQQGVDPTALRADLERSFNEAVAIDIEQHVNTLPAHKGDLFLIPHGTIHGSGKNNLVLEISSTPYIFTFKMYDWMRLDLDGKPRPINIEHAFNNLRFDRQGKEHIEQELVSHPSVLETGEDWTLEHLPTHPDHFYDVHRFTFCRQVEARTGESCHVLNLVQGHSIILETEGGMRQRFNFGETFVVPAAAGGYRLVNEHPNEKAVVVKAFMK